MAATYYCSNADVGMRLGLDSAQRTRAATRLTAAIRRSSIDIDQEFRYYGRDAPTKSIASTYQTNEREKLVFRNSLMNLVLPT